MDRTINKSRAAACSGRGLAPWFGFLLGLVASLPPVAHAQLNENCVVSVLNRNVQAKPDGTWVLPNIPANFGSVRARATCVQGGVTSYGESAAFTIQANGSVTLPPIVLGPTTRIPTSIRVNVPTPILTSAGATAQAQVLATYSGSAVQVDVSAGGTSYSISNPAIASITPGGMITALRSGTVVIQAINEGTQGIAQLRVALGGADSDNDGITDDDELRLGMDPGNPADASFDADHDGLTARAEFEAGTDPRNADSDSDGISDGDEVRCVRGFCTSPMLADSDGDGIRDATEIATGSDPTNRASVNLAAALTALRVTPGSFTLIVNALTGDASVQLAVIGILVDGQQIDLTSIQRQTTYASNNLASCNFGGPDGRVYASQAGVCSITVTNSGKTATVSGTVQDFAPTQLSFVAIPGYANGVAINSDYAFVASGSTGMQVVSLSSDRRTPTIVGSLNLNANANDITLAGNLAYLATSGGLKVVDVSNPRAPRLLGTFAGTGNAMGVKVRGTTAYVAAGSSLYIVSVANPAAMIQAGALDLGGRAWNLDLDMTRNVAAVAVGEAGLKLVDISDLSAPLLRGSVGTGDARGVALRGNTAIVADFANSMTSVSIADLASPEILSRTEQSLGGMLNNVVLQGGFALGADVYFVNGVPIVDITNPQALQPRAILDFPARDDNAMGIAADEGYIYLVTDWSGFERGGSTGDSRLYIGQYQPRTDLAGVQPTATITFPVSGTQVYEGTLLTVTVDAVDDVAVAAVRFSVDGQGAFNSTAAPYQYTFTVPRGVSTLTLGAVAHDLGGNERSAAPVSVSVVPDPLTTVVGLVVDSAGEPVAGAIVTAPGGRSAVSDAAGRFQIADVPTVLGNLVVRAQQHAPGVVERTGASQAVPPVRAGETQVGTITLIEVKFETDYGVLQTRCDDCSVQRTLPFNFSFFGQGYGNAWVGSNGYVTFDAGDNRYTENVHAFNKHKRISAFFDDLYGRVVGGVFVNDSLPDRFIVTYDRTQHYHFGGSNTLQIQLFKDGRIAFAYRGITALGTGSITGLTPGSGAPFQQVDFSAQPSLEVAPQQAVYEYFTSASRFDLDGGFIVFTPVAGGGYQVRTILPPVAAPAATVAGTAPTPLSSPMQLRSASVQQADATGGSGGQGMGNAEVRILSSGHPGYVGMTNTDSQGRFTLAGVPAGGVTVEVRRNGQLIARGAGTTGGGSGADLVNIELCTAQVEPKSGSGK